MAAFEGKTIDHQVISPAGMDKKTFCPFSENLLAKKKNRALQSRFRTFLFDLCHCFKFLNIVKTESGQSETRERGLVSEQGQSSVSASQAAASEIAASNAALDSDDKRAIDQADASQSAISDNQLASFSSQSVSHDQAIGSKIPFWLIGILLTATAIAKLWMLLTDPFADVRVGLPELSVSLVLAAALMWLKIRLGG